MLLAASAWAGEGSAVAAELALDDGAACVTVDELSFRVERLLGQPLAQAEEMQLSVRVAAEGRGFVARLEVSRPRDAEHGVRSLRAASCPALVESLAIAVAVAIGDVEKPPRPAPERVDSAQQASAAPPVPEREPAPSAPPAAASRDLARGPTLAVAAWAIGDSGSLPASALGAGLGLDLAWKALELRAIGTFLPEREGSLVASDPSSPGVSIGLLAGGAVGCVPVALQSASLGMAVCAGGELGQLSGSGTHVLVPYQRHALWAAARFELATRLALPGTPLSVELLVTALAPFARDEFILEDLGEVHRASSVVGRLGLGFSVAVE